MVTLPYKHMYYSLFVVNEGSTIGILAKLVTNKADLHYKIKTATRCCTAPCGQVSIPTEHNKKIVQVDGSKWVSKNKDGNAPLHLLVCKNYLEYYSLLVDCLPSFPKKLAVNNNKETVLHLAMMSNSSHEQLVQVVDELLPHNTDVKSITSKRQTVLDANKDVTAGSSCNNISISFFRSHPFFITAK